MKRKLFQVDIARALGVSPAMISKLRKRGMPVTSVAAALEWRAQNLDPLRARPVPKATQIPAAPSAMHDAKLRRELAEAQLSELELRKRAGSLCEVAAVTTATFSAFRTVRDNMMSVPDRAITLIRAAATDAEAHRILTAELNTALRSAADALGGPAP